MLQHTLTRDTLNNIDAKLKRIHKAILFVLYSNLGYAISTGSKYDDSIAAFNGRIFSTRFFAYPLSGDRS